ncbi:hypothetical protein KUV85_01905 [Nocardioides panacisoli]|uniref:hypothetical protein n=1 Tax=Nocardioides panacisoli TaxID=627624 RepID=UPI001C63716B|nr:hypothetical protein [Nocardioides panacisoli]QYJ04456.1 hypothetical protein KUV85_01905 [Nocardioides panacisoli]
MPERLMMRTAVAALAASSMLAAGATTAATAAESPAPACDEVTVVVDYNELGGAPRTDCVPPGTAAEAFEAAGVALERVPQLGDFVCRVAGKPADGPCSDNDAYWSLWWSDGTAEWTYASLGVGSLEIPAGGAVAFAWHQGADEAEPPDDAAPGGAVANGPDDAIGAEPPPEDDATAGWLVGGVVALVLLAAAVPLLARRRAS